MAKHSLENIWNWDIAWPMMKDAPTLIDRVEAEELPARVASLRELAAIINDTVHQLRAAQRLVLCAARLIEKERRASIAIGEAEQTDEHQKIGLGSSPLLSIKDVMRLLGVSRSTLYHWNRNGLFVRPVQLRQGGRKGYLRHEIDEWLRSRSTAEDKR